jgi:D-xylose transport system substrate-binding protein
MKRINLKFTLIVMALSCAVLLLGCGGRRPPWGAGGSAQPAAVTARGGDAAGTEAVATIGFSVATDTFILERWNKDMKVFSGAVQELGARVIVQLSAGGTREQIAQINYMVNQKIDILVIIANDTEELAGAVKQVRDAGIPVIAYDRLIMGTPLDAYISFDNRRVGRLFGEALIRAVPQGKYLVVNGSVHDSNSFEVSAGLHEVIDPAITAGDVQLEQELWLEEWSFDEALEKIGAIFEESTDFDAISCGNDAIASAAIQLLAERRLAGKVAVVGQDAELISCQHILEGLQLMTVYKPIGKLAARAARLAVALAAKTPLPPDALLDNRSGIPVSAYIEEPVAVYKDNMEVIIRDGFHSYEDVYRNMNPDQRSAELRGE